MSRKRAVKTSVRQNVYQLEQALVANGRAVQEGPKKKTWSKHDIATIKPLTHAQTEMFHDFFAGQNIVASGSAGSGKTFVGVYLALNEILSPKSNVSKIIIVRSAVATRDMGFMPGTLEEKTALFEAPYRDIFSQLMKHENSYQDMKEAKLVEFITTSYIRGSTWDDAVVIVDEFQNMSAHELNSIMTRMGQNSRIIFAGDMVQTDLRKHRGDVSGADQLLKVTDKMSQFNNVIFTHHDIVRSQLVKDWIIAAEEVGMVD
jgi:phosphate starvation-inducible protein PhoH and related proteins